MTTVSAADAALRVPTSPYKGLVPYAEEDAPFFFGRDEWREIIIDNLRAYRLTLLYGASGIGKSSVLRAGVQHELRERAKRATADSGRPGVVIVVFRKWREDPLGELIRHLRAATDDALGEHAAPVDPQAPVDLSATLAECAGRVSGKVFVVLDQFEEYFLYHGRDDGGDPFAEAFIAAVNRRDLRASFVISIREDAVARLDRFKGRLPSLFDNYLRIDQLDRDAAREAIVKPLEHYARLTGNRVEPEPELVEAVLDEVEAGKVSVGPAGSGVVDPEAGSEGEIETPYLQLVLTRLWDEEMRLRSDTLRLATFQRLGGAEGIVRTHLDEAMGALSELEQDIAAELFNHLVTPSGSKIVQNDADLASYVKLPFESVGPILGRLSGDVRILRPIGDGCYEIYHDALAAPILDWRGRWQASQDRRREHKRTRFYGAIAVASAVVAAAVFVLAIFAIHAKQEALQSQKKVNRSASIDLAGSALLRLRSAPEQAASLALKAYDRAHTPEAAGALRSVVSQPSLTAMLRAKGGDLGGATFSPDSRLVATTANRGQTEVWNVKTGRLLASLPGRSRVRGDSFRPLRAAFSPDGKLLATVGDDGATRLWGAPRWNLVTTLRGHRGAVLSAAFDDAGRRLVTSGADGTVRVREVSSRRTLAVLRAGATGPVRSVALSPDGSQVAVAEPDSAISLWRAAGGKRVVRLNNPQERGEFEYVANLSVAYSSTGRRLLAVTEDGWARLWDVARRRIILAVRDKGGAAINAAALSPDGTRFVVATDSDTAVVYRAAKPRKVIATLKPGGEVSTVAFSPDGLRVVTGDSTGTAALWDPQRPARPTMTLTARSRQETLWTVAFSPDGRTIVTAGGDEARLWGMGVDRPVLTLPRQPAAVDRVGFSPEGMLMVTSGGGDVRVWRTADGHSVAVLEGGVGKGLRPGVNTCSDAGVAVGFSRNGRRFLTIRGRGTSVWDTGSWDKVADLTHTPSPPGFYGLQGIISPDGKRVATCDRGRIRLWNATTGRPTGAVLRASDASFSPDGKLLVTTEVDKTTFWRVSDGRRVPSPIKPASAFGAPVYSRDGTLVAAADGKRRVRVWEVASGKRIATLGRSESFGGYAFTPDGRLLAINRDAATQIWDVTEERRLRTVPGFVATENGSHDGEFLVVTNGARASIAQSSAGQSFADLPGPVRSAVFHPKSHRIATAAADGIVRIYSCIACGSAEHLVELVKARLARARDAQRKKP